MSIKNTETLMQVLSTCMTSGNLKCFQAFEMRYRFKIFFVYKYIKIKFYYFKKIIFNISTSKQSKNIKKYLKKNQNF